MYVEDTLLAPALRWTIMTVHVAGSQRRQRDMGPITLDTHYPVHRSVFFNHANLWLCSESELGYVLKVFYPQNISQWRSYALPDFDKHSSQIDHVLLHILGLIKIIYLILFYEQKIKKDEEKRDKR